MGRIVTLSYVTGKGRKKTKKFYFYKQAFDYAHNLGLTEFDICGTRHYKL